MTKIKRIRNRRMGTVHIEHRRFESRAACGALSTAGFDYVHKAVTCKRCSYVYGPLYGDMDINRLRGLANHLNSLGGNPVGDLWAGLPPKVLRVLADYMEEQGFMTEGDALKEIILEYTTGRKKE